MAKRLYRSTDDRVVAGVCGGLAQYFDIDPIIVRVLAVVSLFLSGVGLIAYLVLWIAVPLKGSDGESADRAKEGVDEIKQAAGELGQEVRSLVTGEGDPEEMTRIRNRRRNWLGAIVLIAGVLILLANLNVFWWFHWGIFWAVVLIAVGLAVVLSARRR